MISLFTTSKNNLGWRKMTQASYIPSQIHFLNSNLMVKNSLANSLLLFPFFSKYCALLYFLALTRAEGTKLPKYHKMGRSQGYFLSSKKYQKSCRMANTNFLLQTLEVCICIHICIFWVLGQTETFSLSIANKHVSSFFALTSVVKNVIFPEVYLFCL